MNILHSSSLAQFNDITLNGRPSYNRNHFAADIYILVQTVMAMATATTTLVISFSLQITNIHTVIHT